MQLWHADGEKRVALGVRSVGRRGITAEGERLEVKLQVCARDIRRTVGSGQMNGGH